MGKELEELHRIESSHWGHKSLIILASIILLAADIILRGEAEVSIVGIKECQIGKS